MGLVGGKLLSRNVRGKGDSGKTDLTEFLLKTNWSNKALPGRG